MEGGIRVLCVDDEPDLRKTVRDFLEQAGGFTVDTAVSAEEALGLQSIRSYDAIISGYLMPGMDGIAFLKTVRERFGNIPFILFTGRGSEDAAMAAVNNGADFYLKKGTDPREQVAVIAEKIRLAVRDRKASRMPPGPSVRDLENRFSIIFRRSPVAFTLVSASDGTFVDVNDAFLQNSGYSRDEIIGRTAEEVGIFSGGEGYKRFVSSLQERQMVHGFELKCKIKNGMIRTCLLSSGIIMMDGMPHILSTIEDVTEWKITESALQAIVSGMAGTTGLNALQKITENIRSWLGADCVMVGEIQPDCQTVKVLSMLLDGKEVRGFSYPLRGTPCENVADKGFCLYSDNASRLFPQSRDLAGLNIQGYIGTPLRGFRGEVIGILCVLSRSPFRPTRVMRDIIDIIAVKASAEVERLRIERELRESRQMLAGAMDLANLVNWEFDARTKVFTFDDRFYALYGTTSLREGGNRMTAEKYIQEFVHPEDRDAVIREVKKALQATDPRYKSQMEHRIIRRDGETRHIIVRIAMKTFSDGHTLETHGANQDITERKRAEEALQQANRKLNLLSGITRHDIKNQLLILDGFIALLHNRIPDPAYNDYFTRITLAYNQILNLIQFTKEYEKIGVQAPAWQDLRSLVDTAIRDAPPANVALINDLPAGLEVFADPMIARVFINLIDNALRHGGRITTIRFMTETRDGQRVILCTDDGSGVAAEEKKKIFDRGYGMNTGLGLALSREILDITGITIRENGDPSTGARFEIAVPASLHRLSPP